MKKKIFAAVVLLCSILLIAISAWKFNSSSNKETEVQTTIVEAEPEEIETEETIVTTSQLVTVNQNQIDINDIDFIFEEEESEDGSTYLTFSYKNNTEYVITDVDIFLSISDNTSEETLNNLFSYYIENEWLEVDNLNEILMEAYNGKITSPGETADGVVCHLTEGIKADSLSQYNIMEMDTVFIRYIIGEQMYAFTYDCDTESITVNILTSDDYQLISEFTGEAYSEIPVIDAQIITSSVDEDDCCAFYAYGISYDEFLGYIEECISYGFSEIDIEDDEAFRGYDENGGYIYMSYSSDTDELFVYYSASN